MRGALTLPLAVLATTVLALAAVITLSWRVSPASLAQTGGLNSVFQATLDQSTARKEGQRYAHALERAGLKVSPQVRRIIDQSLAVGHHSESSLAVSSKLQKGIALADEMDHMTQLATTKAHKQHAHQKSHMDVHSRPSDDSIRLAEEILGQPVQAAAKPMQPATKSVSLPAPAAPVKLGPPNMGKAAFKKAFAEAAGDDVKIVAGHVKAAAKAAALAKKIRVAKAVAKVSHPQASKSAAVTKMPPKVSVAHTTKPLGFKAAMLQHLDRKATRMLHKRERAEQHAALSQSDLAHTEWDHSHDEMQAVQKGPGDNRKLTRVQLEEKFEKKLNGKAARLAQSRIGSVLAHRASQTAAVLHESKMPAPAADWNAAVDHVGDWKHADEGAVAVTVGDGSIGTAMHVPRKLLKKSRMEIEQGLSAQLSMSEHALQNRAWRKELGSFEHSSHHSTAAPKHAATRVSSAHAHADAGFAVGGHGDATRLLATDGATKSRMGLEKELAQELAAKVKDLESKSAAVRSYEAHAVVAQTRAAMRKPVAKPLYQMTVGSSADGTDMRVSDSASETNEALEAALRNQLNSEAGTMGARELVKHVKSLAGGQSAADVTGKVAAAVGRGAGEAAVDEAAGLQNSAAEAPADPRMALEARLKAQLVARDQARGARWFKADLMSAEKQAKGESS